jgi:hypothetical protein
MVAGCFGELRGLNVTAYVYYILQDFKIIKTEQIPNDVRDMVITWPKVSSTYNLIDSECLRVLRTNLRTFI